MNQNTTTPEELLKFLTKPQMVRCAIIALVIHVVLLVATSVAYLGDAARYHTVDVKGAKAAERKAEADRAEAERKAEALKKAEENARRQEEERRQKEQAAAAQAPAVQQPSGPTAKAVSEISDERPQATSMELDLDSL